MLSKTGYIYLSVASIAGAFLKEFVFFEPEIVAAVETPVVEAVAGEIEEAIDLTSSSDSTMHMAIAAAVIFASVLGLKLYQNYSQRAQPDEPEPVAQPEASEQKDKKHNKKKEHKAEKAIKIEKSANE